MSYQLTLAIFKPDLVARPASLRVSLLSTESTFLNQFVCRMLEDEGLFIVQKRVLRLSLQEASLFYEEHKGLFADYY